MESLQAAANAAEEAQRLAEEQVATAAAEREKAESKAEAAKEELQDVTATSEATATELKNLAEDYARLQESMKDADGAASALEAAQQELEDVRRECEALKAASAEWEGEVNRAAEEAQALSQKVEELQEEATAARAAQESADATVESTIERLSTLITLHSPVVDTSMTLRVSTPVFPEFILLSAPLAIGKRLVQVTVVVLLNECASCWMSSAYHVERSRLRRAQYCRCTEGRT